VKSVLNIVNGKSGMQFKAAKLVCYYALFTNVFYLELYLMHT